MYQTFTLYYQLLTEIQSLASGDEISSSKKIGIAELLYSESVKTKRENGRASLLPIKYMGKDYRWTFDQYDHGRKRRVCQINYQIRGFGLMTGVNFIWE